MDLPEDVADHIEGCDEAELQSVVDHHADEHDVPGVLIEATGIRERDTSVIKVGLQLMVIIIYIIHTRFIFFINQLMVWCIKCQISSFVQTQRQSVSKSSHIQSHFT